MARDLDDVLRQMAGNGIAVPPGLDLDVAFRKVLRFRPDGARKPKKSAWMRLFEYRSNAGATYITGAYGDRGDQFTVEATRSDWTPADRAEWLEHRRNAEKKAEAELAADHAAAASKAQRMWRAGRELRAGEEHAYLARKRVGAFGVRLGFNGRLLVPLRDVRGELRGLQYVSSEGEKLFGTGTQKEGAGHLLGTLTSDAPLLAFAEGYATAASVHMAAGWPVVCCFDAGNLAPVMAEYRRLYPHLAFVVTADDDRHLHRRLAERLSRVGITCTLDDLRASLDREWRVPDGPVVELKAGWRGDAVGVMRIEGTLTVGGVRQQLLVENAGQAKAHAAAKRFKARVMTPFFADRASPATDWNDLHCSAGLESVKAQLDEALDAPPEKPAASARTTGNGKGRGRDDRDGGGGGGPGPVDDDGVPFLERFTLIYGTTTVWDQKAREIVRIEALTAAFGRRVAWWMGMPERRIVPQRNVVFDPAGNLQPPDYVNLFDALPLKPVDNPSRCARIVGHVWNLCQENDQLFQWLVSWLAYPLQHPGAKMRTAVLMFGRTEGTGKTRLGEIMRMIYGRYSTTVGQAELQRDFNEWLSSKLLVVCEEVVSQADRGHHQGMLQALVTNPTVQINAKNMPVREEANHANLMFFSNQQTPLKLNMRDRRYTVIKIEAEHPPEYFEAIHDELRNGGAEAFYGYLLKHDLKGFNEFTRPFESADRLRLITLGMSPDQRFFQFWSAGHAGVPFCTAPATDLYAAFRAWCRMSGERFPASATAFGRTVSEELERLECPPKRSLRYQGYSSKQIASADWAGDTTTRQGVVYFVRAGIEVMQSRSDGDEPVKRSEAEPDCRAPDQFNARIKRFQAQLAALQEDARRFI